MSAPQEKPLLLVLAVNLLTQGKEIYVFKLEYIKEKYFMERSETKEHNFKNIYFGWAKESFSANL